MITNNVAFLLPLATSCGNAGVRLSSGPELVSTHALCRAWCPPASGQHYYSMVGFVQNGFHHRVFHKPNGLIIIIILAIFPLHPQGQAERPSSRATTS